MRFCDIHKKVLALWPDSIAISDNGVPSEESEGHYFPALGDAWTEVENIVGHDDHFAALMVWTHFQAFHAEGMRLVKGQKDILRPRQVDATAIEERYFENLHGEDYVRELEAYERVIES